MIIFDIQLNMNDVYTMIQAIAFNLTISIMIYRFYKNFQ